MSTTDDIGIPLSDGLPPRHLLAAALVETEGAFLSHGAALAWHGLALAPPGFVTATSARYARNRPVGGAALRFVRCAAGDRRGVSLQIVPGGPGLLVSDPERTVVDALRRPDLCGGLAAVVGALWRGRARLAPDLLADHALRLPIASTGRRLGFLLELLAIAGPDTVGRLLPGPTSTWTLLDPIRTPSGPRLRRWGLRLNVDPRELAAEAGVEGADRASASPPPAIPVLFPLPARAEARAVQVGRPRRLAGLCRRHDLLRLVVLEGAWAEIAGATLRDRQGRLPAFDPARIRAERAGYDAPADPAALPILVEMHTERILGPAALLAVECELAQLLGRPVRLRTMRELLHRVARLAFHAGTVIYHRHDRGQ
jgi:predicted transcriptional regulator of viral defense system